MRYVSHSYFQEMTKDAAGLRTGPKDSYHDKVFEEEINNLINTTKEHYELYAATLSLSLTFFEHAV